MSATVGDRPACQVGHMNKDTKGADTKPRASASDRIVRDVLRGLYEGRYVAGQRLVEPDLVTRYNVSRSSVREAIKRLAAQGVVEAQHNRGARIRQLTRKEARNILMITEVIVGLAARLAAENIDRDGARADLEEALAALMDANTDDNRYDFVRMRNRFHRTMARISGSPELEQTLANLQVHLVRNRLVMKPEDRAASYKRIADAILNGDGMAAEDAARRHVRVMIDLLDQVYVPPFLGEETVD